MGFFIQDKKLRDKTISLSLSLSRVTVIIPAWNEQVGIEKTILSVVDSTYKNIEIIVVDDGSTDDTSKNVTRLRRKLLNKNKIKRGQLRLLHQKNAGKAMAINRGVKKAKGDLILTIDADSYIEKNSIKTMKQALDNKKFSVAIGEIEVSNTKRMIGKIQHYEYIIGFHNKRSQHIFNSAYIFPGALTMFRASLLKDIGNFNGETCTEDLEISMRIKQAGYRVVYVDSAVCYTEGASTLNGLLNQRTRWRHGYLECVINNPKFIFSFKKGVYLSLIDFPLQLFSVIEILIDPLVFGLMIITFLGTITPLSLLSPWIISVFILLITTNSRPSELRTSPHLPLFIFLMPFGLFIVSIIEYLALVKSIYRIIVRKQTKWTTWNRLGANS